MLPILLLLIQLAVAQQTVLQQQQQQQRVLIYKTNDYADDLDYGALVAVFEPYGRVQLLDSSVGLIADLGDDVAMVVAIGSSSHDAQAQWQQQNVTFVSLGFPIHFPLAAGALAVAPLVDLKCRTPFTFAIEHYHQMRMNATVQNVLVPDTAFADFFRSSPLVDAVALALVDGWQQDDTAVREVLALLEHEAHPGLVPPCQLYSDRDPQHVPAEIACRVGSEFMTLIQMQIGVGHVARNYRVTRLVGNSGSDGRAEGVQFSGALVGLPRNVTIVGREEQHYAWQSNPHHLPEFNQLADGKWELVGISEPIYRQQFHAHASLRLGNKHADSEYGDALSRGWPQPHVGAMEYRGKLASRQRVMQALGHPTADFDTTDQNVPMPFMHVDVGVVVTQWFHEAAELEVLWQPQEAVKHKVADGERGFCARLNLVAIRQAFQSVGFAGVTYQRVVHHKLGSVVIVRPAIASSQKLTSMQQILADAQIAVAHDQNTLWKIAPLWIWRDLSVSPIKLLGARTAVIQSSDLRIDTNFIIPLAAGIHFCKIVSPTRVLEMLMYGEL